MFRSRGVLVAVCVGLLALVVTAPSWAQEGTRYRIILMNGSKVEGVGKKNADGSYEIKADKGPTLTIKKGEIKSVTTLDAAAKDDPSKATPGLAGGGGRNDAQKVKRANVRPEISEDAITALLKDISISLEEQAAASEDILAEPGEESPINEPSVDEMKRIAGSKARVYTTPHFVFVYTSEPDLARQMASRLESIYRWTIRWQELLGIPSHAPEFKLEIYFFATWEEYRAYMTTVGLEAEMSNNALGFYQPNFNRSAFYDMHTWPQVAPAFDKERMKNLPWRDRERLRAKAERIAEYYNVTVTQHEAAHHIHHNTGVFNRRVDRSSLLSWHVEGLATMFEAPPGSTGSSFGSLNHVRLKEFREFFGRGWQAMGDVRTWISNQRVWQGFPHYSLGYAMHYYLLKTKRDNYFKYMRLVAARVEEDTKTAADLVKEFEDHFGRIDEKWLQEWHKFIMRQHFKPSTIPDLELR